VEARLILGRMEAGEHDKLRLVARFPQQDLLLL
jgi:hypothetical protein